MQNDRSNQETRRLSVPDTTESVIPLRATGPLEEELPWVIEFRVVGTASTIQAQVHEAMIIGRSDPQAGIYPDIDLAPHGAQGNGVSRQHAAVLARDNRIRVKDLGSVNGTRLNGYPLAPQQEYRMRHGDELEIGQVKLQVRFAVVPTMGSAPSDSSSNHITIPTVGSGQRVMIVEDDSDVGKVFSIALRHAGFDVTVVENAAEALAAINREAPDVIVLDLMLPDMSGFDLVRLVRKDIEHHIPMIVCSGATAGFQMNKAREAGADGFLSKPVSVDELLRAIESVIAPAVSG